MPCMIHRRNFCDLQVPFEPTSVLVFTWRKWRRERVVEASHHSLNAKNVGPGKQTARESPVYSFLFRESMSSSRPAGGCLHTLAQHLLAQILLPCKGHVKLRRHLMKDFRPNIDWRDAMPWRASAPLLGKSAQVYVLSFCILEGIDGRAELPTVKFNRNFSLFDMHLYMRYLVLWKTVFLTPSNFRLMLREFVIDWFARIIVFLLW